MAYQGEPPFLFRVLILRAGGIGFQLFRRPSNSGQGDKERRVWNWLCFGFCSHPHARYSLRTLAVWHLQYSNFHGGDNDQRRRKKVRHRYMAGREKRHLQISIDKTPYTISTFCLDKIYYTLVLRLTRSTISYYTIIKFYVIPANTPFLYYIQDMDKMGVYFLFVIINL